MRRHQESAGQGVARATNSKRPPLGSTRGGVGVLDAYAGDLLWSDECGFYVYLRDHYTGNPAPCREAPAWEVLTHPVQAWRVLMGRGPHEKGRTDA